VTTRTTDAEVERAANYLASMPKGNTTVPTSVLKALLLKYDGRIMSRGSLCDIKSKRIGPGVYRLWLEVWDGGRLS
jgi:hypothetical protein